MSSHYAQRVQTERLLLRGFSAADVDLLVELDSDPEVMRFLTGGQSTPREVVADEVLPRLLAEYERYPGFGRWAAVEKTSSEFIGWFALRPPGTTTNVELGYRLRRAAWGKG